MSTRRSLIVAGTSGLITGSVGAATWMARPQKGRVRLGVIGDKASQLWLLDTDSERVLFAMGAPNERLLEHLPMLATVDRRRIDILVANHVFLSTVGTELIDRHRIAHIISVQTDPSLPSFSWQNITAVSPVQWELSEGVTVEIETEHRAVSEESYHAAPDWVARITRGDLAIAITNRESVAIYSPVSFALVGLPEIDGMAAKADQLLVSNGSDNEGASKNHLQAFVSDPLWFELSDEGLVLPNSETLYSES